jgi:hypothetical protein
MGMEERERGRRGRRERYLFFLSTSPGCWLRALRTYSVGETGRLSGPMVNFNNESRTQCWESVEVEREVEREVLSISLHLSPSISLYLPLSLSLSISISSSYRINKIITTKFRCAG